MPWFEDPDEPSGFRYVPASAVERTTALPARESVSYAGLVDHPGPQPTVEDGQEDLTGDDYLAVPTAKVFEDEALPQPPQDPAWRPASVVDEWGQPT